MGMEESIVQINHLLNSPWRVSNEKEICEKAMQYL